MEIVSAEGEGLETIASRTSCFQVIDCVPILTFDPSVENFLSAVEAISQICGEAKEESFEASEIERFKSLIVFLKEWKQFFFCDWMPFYYKPKTVNFTYQAGSAESKPAINGLKLPQFSSAAIPKDENHLPNTTSAFGNDDFVLHVGGSVWALDWCPRLHENFDCDVKCEYLAIAAHPIGSEYHKIGERLSGRGFIQIWCFPHLCDKEELPYRAGNHRRGEVHRGRPRKTVPAVLDKINGSGKFDPSSKSAIDISNTISGPRKNRGGHINISIAKTSRPRGRPRKHPIVSSSSHTTIMNADNLDGSRLISAGCCMKELNKGNNSVNDLKGIEIDSQGGFNGVTEKDIEINLQQDFNDGAYSMNSYLLDGKWKVDDGVSVIYADNDQDAKTKGLTENSVQEKFFITEGMALPRLMLSLAHNGKVAWDVKWRPSDPVDSKSKYRLGYLAVLLGNGSLEVWEVPVHNIVKLLYAGCHTEGTDPRFVKLQPVFTCSSLKSGERQSIPLTLEWSPSASRDFILVGCHDGTIAMWKFCSQHSSQDTKPILFFTADKVPIRSLAWAPDDSDSECSNLIVTAGHEGLKFWDLRNPYRPLLDLCLVQRAVLGLDWLKDPRCVVIAYDDGTIRILSLAKIANDIPATGELVTGTKQQGLHFQSCSSFSIWSVQVSRITGLVAYCSSDGHTRYFQLTPKAVGKDPNRYRQPHFLCGSLTDDGLNLCIYTPSTSIPLLEHSLVSKVAANEARPVNSPMQALCWHDNKAINNNGGQKKRKCSPSNQKEAGEEDALQIVDSRRDEFTQNISKFPPKTVAMHRVRWNMNKGSGRWLCYGGAAGIVRCQAISPR